MSLRPTIVPGYVNRRGDAALDNKLCLVALEHDAGKYLQDRDADARCHAECDETIEPVLHLRINAHDHTPFARGQLRKRSQTIRIGCQTQ